MAAITSTNLGRSLFPLINLQAKLPVRQHLVLNLKTSEPDVVALLFMRDLLDPELKLKPQNPKAWGL